MPKRDLYQQVTDKIVSALEGGLDGNWERPWIGRKGGLPFNATTKKAYRGVNVLMLWASAMEQGFQTDQWASYKQWQARGAQVRKGEKGTMVVYVGTVTPRDEPRANEGTGDFESEEQTVRFLKCSTVFNADQVDGYNVENEPMPDLAERLDHADEFVTGTGANIQLGGARAFYAPGPDIIQVPQLAAFKETGTSTATENYYSTLLHELTHWTGAKRRCDRQFGRRFGDHAYACEELVAELGAAFLCAQLGITNEPRDDHAKYIKSWLAALKDDKRFVFAAASKASEACDYLDGLQAAEAAALAA